MSRSLLHLKMKKITNKSTSDFIKDIKMQRAKELIKRGFPIGEVAYKVGFSDPNYFSRAFKKSEGMSPSSYIRKKRASLIEE
ncbi:MAG: helix-turn-helix transcriptional regulator [Bacteroidota bacterium]